MTADDNDSALSTTPDQEGLETAALDEEDSEEQGEYSILHNIGNSIIDFGPFNVYSGTHRRDQSGTGREIIKEHFAQVNPCFLFGGDERNRLTSSLRIL